jgi:type II secretory pathway component GspD/PulD (secretin)
MGNKSRPGMMKAFAPFIEAGELAASTAGEDTILTTVFELKHANAQESMNLLQSYFSDPMSESVRASMQSNCVVVTGRLRGLRVTQKMLAALDQAPADPIVSEVVQLRFVDANSIAETLAQWARFRPRQDALAPAVQGPNPPNLDVVPYAERNAIIVSGPRSRVEQTKALVAVLDVEAKKS